MEFVLKPSPDHIAAVKLATTLWNQSDIRDAISQLCKSSCVSEYSFLDIERQVKEKVPQQEVLREKVLSFIKPIGYEIFLWVQYHSRTYLKIDLPREFCWMPHGTIDKKKTAEMLVKDEGIDIIMRYKLACIYCLENSVRELWSQLHEACRKDFGNDKKQEFLVLIWTETMKEHEKGRTYFPYQLAFKQASEYGNVVASEYFLLKLTSNEREELLVPTAIAVAKNCVLGSNVSCGFIREYCSETLCFLLSKMDSEKLTKIFKEVPREVLSALLDWPRQFFFKETASVMINFLPTNSCSVLLSLIISKVIDGHKYFNYQELFGETWRLVPEAHKRSVLNDVTYSHNKLLANLFKIRDENNIKSILRDATLYEKERIIKCSNAQDICIDLMLEDEFDLLNYFIRECISSKNEMTKFLISCHETVEQTIIQCWSGEAIGQNSDKLGKFFQLLNDILFDFDKK